jgi:phage shock protein C
MTCPNCQKEIAAGSSFCYSCGAKQPQTGSGEVSRAPGYSRRLTRSSTDKKIAGVCAGLAEYFDLDPTIIRLVWVLAFFFGGAGGLAYLVLWIVLPEAPSRHNSSAPSSGVTASS